MNLHSIASGAIGAVNPFRVLTLNISTGYITAPDGSRTPIIEDSPTLMGQVQPLSGGDRRQLDGLTLNGTERAIYITGESTATVRLLNKGGDTFTDDQGNNWKVIQVLEQWPDWVKVATALQNNNAYS